MARTDADAVSRSIMEEVGKGRFAPVYLLMGTEPYYPDLVCDFIVRHALGDAERDFNQSVWHGMDTDAAAVISQARSYPVMAERRLLVVRDAQQMDLEKLAPYCADPMDTTVLVLLLHGVSSDKRRSLYRNVVRNGRVLESDTLRDYQMDGWVQGFYRQKGLELTPEAATLLVEAAGTSMTMIASETDKLLKSLPEGTRRVTAEDVERNVGISRRFSVFELTKALSYKEASKAVRIAARVGSAPGFYILSATAALFTHFYRLLKFEALGLRRPPATAAQKAAALGINPYFLGEYEAAARNYPFGKCLQALRWIEEYDFKGKGAPCGGATQAELLIELTVKLLT